jgi:hypothetical protein
VVSVKVAIGDADRSLLSSAVQYYVDNYEVVFKSSTNQYYRGTGTAVDGFVTVNVPVGTGYSVVLLAGYKSFLLAAGYNTPVSIVAGKANLISIGISSVSPQWKKANDTNDGFQFEAAIAANAATTIPITGGALIVAPYEVDAYLPASGDTFTVKFAPDKAFSEDGLTALKVGSTLNIADYSVTLHHRYNKDPIDPIVLPKKTSGSGISGSAGAYAFTDTGVVFENNGGTSTLALPTRDIDLLLEIEFSYYAFGTADSTGRKWIIKNGLTYEPDDGKLGGLFPVKIGNGTPEDLKVPPLETTVTP